MRVNSWIILGHCHGKCGEIAFGLFPRKHFTRFGSVQRDGGSREHLLNAMKASNDLDLIAAGVRLLGATMPQRAQLAAWVSEKLGTFDRSQGPADFGYDIIAGSYRPVQHCLLESCLTR